MATFIEFLKKFDDADVLSVWAKNSGLSDLQAVRERVADLRFNDALGIISNDDQYGTINNQNKPNTSHRTVDNIIDNEDKQSTSYNLDNEQELLFNDIETLSQIIPSDNIIQLEPEVLINQTQNYAMKSEKKRIQDRFSHKQ